MSEIPSYGITYCNAYTKWLNGVGNKHSQLYPKLNSLLMVEISATMVSVSIERKRIKTLNQKMMNEHWFNAKIVSILLKLIT